MMKVLPVRKLVIIWSWKSLQLSSFIHSFTSIVKERKNKNWRLTNRTERFCFLGNIRGLTSVVRVLCGGVGDEKHQQN